MYCCSVLYFCGNESCLSRFLHEYVLKLKINDSDLFNDSNFGNFPGGQCTRENRIDPKNPELRFALCNNAKLIVSRAKSVAESALAIAKAVLTGSDPWDDIKKAWENKKRNIIFHIVVSPVMTVLHLM